MSKFPSIPRPVRRVRRDDQSAGALPEIRRPIYQTQRGPVSGDASRFVPNLTSPFVGTNYSSRNAEWWDPNLRNPYVMNFNASVQYEFARNYLLDVSYQGSAGVGLIERWQANTFPIDYFAGNPTQRNGVRAAAQNYRPFPAVRRYPLPVELRPLHLSFGHREIGEALLRRSVLLDLLHVLESDRFAGWR